MHKKSQITYFILFSIIIFIAGGFIFYINNQKIKEVEVHKSYGITSDIAPVKLYIENCIVETGKNALLYIGKHGGYYKLRNPKLEDSNFNLTYYLFDNIDFSPSLGYIEKEISNYIDNNLQFCINDFNEFKKQGFDITNHNISTNTKIGTNSISFDVNILIEIRKDKNIQKIDNFNGFINQVNLYNIHNVSKEITYLQYKEPYKLCLSCFYELSEENNLYISVLEHLNNTLVFQITDYNTSITGIYNFTFAVSYPEVSCKNLQYVEDTLFLNSCLEQKKTKLENKININPVPDFSIPANSVFYYEINAYGRGVVYEDFTDLFDINKTNGVISFKSNSKQIGVHNIWIKARDTIGNEDYANFHINITK